MILMNLRKLWKEILELKIMRKSIVAILLAACQWASAQTSSLVVQDIDAGNYIRAGNITSRAIADDINNWYLGLKSLGVYTNILYMADFHIKHGAWDYLSTAERPTDDGYGMFVATNGQSIRVMLGTNTSVIGTIQIDSNGAKFTNHTSQAIQISNTFGATLSKLTMFAAFKAEQNGSGQHVFGGFSGSSSRGPTMWAHGTPYFGYNPTYLYQTLSGSGSTNFANGGTVAGLVSSHKVTGHNQTAFTTYSSVEVKCTGGIETPAYTTNVYESAVWNGSTYWYAGRTGDTALPLNGNVRSVIVFNRDLCFEEMAAVRRLFHITIGRDYCANVNFHTEGDSLTAGSGAQGIWSVHLMTNSTYGQKFQRRMLATGGHTIDNVVNDYPTNVAPFNIEFPYCAKQYYFLQVGINSLANGDSPDSMYDRLSRLWDKAKNDGYRVVAFTVTGSESLTATQEGNRQSLNNRIRNARGRWDILIDTANLPELVTYGSAANSTYYIDGVHYTTAGHQVVAREIIRQLGSP